MYKCECMCVYPKLRSENFTELNGESKRETEIEGRWRYIEFFALAHISARLIS